MEIYLKVSLVSIFYFLLVFNQDFIICIDFTHISVLNTVPDDVI